MKRKTDAGGDRHGPKRLKSESALESSTHNGRAADQAPRGPPRGLEPGMTGIWATCAMGKEGLCVRDLRNAFERYAEDLYSEHAEDGVAQPEPEPEAGRDIEEDIEADIRNELQDMKAARSSSLFTAIKIDTQCLIFFQTRAPVEPVSFVRHVCQDAARAGQQKVSRFVQRLTPVTKMAKATDAGLVGLAKDVLAPHFHADGTAGKKFAIRPNIRNHKVLSRDSVIQQVASAVGPGHTVDLKQYDLLILVEVYKNICGMSVVGSDYDTLKRYNLSELAAATKTAK